MSALLGLLGLFCSSLTSFRLHHFSLAFSAFLQPASSVYRPFPAFVFPPSTLRFFSHSLDSTLSSPRLRLCLALHFTRHVLLSFLIRALLVPGTHGCNLCATPCSSCQSSPSFPSPSFFVHASCLQSQPLFLVSLLSNRGKVGRGEEGAK